jgi:hypothetical protein
MFPAAAILLTLFFMTGQASFESATFYCIVFGTLASPPVYGSGIYDWKVRFKGRITSIFSRKIFFGMTLLGISLLLIVVRVILPEIAYEGSSLRWIYLGAVYAVTAMAVYLGHLGSKFL